MKHDICTSNRKHKIWNNEYEILYSVHEILVSNMKRQEKVKLWHNFRHETLNFGDATCNINMKYKLWKKKKKCIEHEIWQTRDTES